MAVPHTYITTTLPYVNARPHLGFALELVQADVLARHYRQQGDKVRFQAGTDDNSLKNVLAAEAAGVPVQEFVDRNAAAFVALREPLSLSVDDVIRTSRDARHRVGVERLWLACAEAGDLYRRHYEGLYCVGCEQFYTVAELDDGRCPEHGTAPQRVCEENWFFRLSRYADQLYELISSGRLRVEPAEHRNEVLSFIAGGLADFSVSRSTTRARGWGIPVPGDPGQVIYVWWDALGNYISALGYGAGSTGCSGGTDGAGGTGSAEYQDWWVHSRRRVHLAGKGVIRFHAVYWPAMLLSAGEPLPTDVLVHDYLTVGGQKISKSAGGTVDPAALAEEFGSDAVRWWLLREVSRVGDTDFTVERLVARANDELANGLGNLVNRVVSMIHRYRDGHIPDDPFGGTGGTADDGEDLAVACREARGLIRVALEDFDFRRASGAIWAVVDEANRYVNRVRPWDLAKAERTGAVDAAHQLDAVLVTLIQACATIGGLLAPFLPDAAARITEQCSVRGNRLPEPRPLFTRIRLAVPENLSGGV
jgi:methionyl-tRNA synthetase